MKLTQKDYKGLSYSDYKKVVLENKRLKEMKEVKHIDKDMKGLENDFEKIIKENDALKEQANQIREIIFTQKEEPLSKLDRILGLLK